MKVGINLLLWTAKPSAEHIPLIAQLKGMGFDGIEFEVDVMDNSDIRALKKTLEEQQLGATAIAVIPHLVGDPSSPDKKQRLAAVDYLKDCIDKAKALGSDLLGGPLTEGIGKKALLGPSEDEIKWVAETLRMTAEYAQSVDMKLACEIINRFEARMANTVDQMLDIVEKVGMPNVGLHVDTHHGNIEETDICAAWKKASDKIFLVHISENMRGIPGTGPAVKPEIFKTLKDIGYDGWLSIEAFFLNVPEVSARLNVWRKYAESEIEIAQKGLAYIRQHI